MGHTRRRNTPDSGKTVGSGGAAHTSSTSTSFDSCVKLSRGTKRREKVDGRREKVEERGRRENLVSTGQAYDHDRAQPGHDHGHDHDYDYDSL